VAGTGRDIEGGARDIKSLIWYQQAWAIRHPQ